MEKVIQPMAMVKEGTQWVEVATLLGAPTKEAKEVGLLIQAMVTATIGPGVVIADLAKEEEEMGAEVVVVL